MTRLVSWLGSRGKTAYLLFAYCACVVLLAIWGARVPAAVTGNIARLPALTILYVAAGLHLFACLVSLWSLVRLRCSLEVPADDPGTLLPAPPAAVAEEAIRLGFRRAKGPGDATVLVRHRFSPVGTFVFHAALLLLPVSWLASRETRFEGSAWIVEGHPFGGTRAEYARVTPENAFDARAPRVAFEVERIDAVFWGDRLFFTDLAALLRVPGEAEPVWIRLPQPARVGGARVTMRGFNYTPAVEITGREGEPLEAADASLWLFPPGTEDSFAIPGLPYRFFVRLYPDSEGPEARPVNRGNELKRPLFHVAVTSGKRLVTHGWLRPGEPLSFDGLTLRLPAIRKGGEVVIHRDAGYPVLWVALVLALVGASARIACPSSRVWLQADGEGTRAVVREDVFARGRAGRLLGNGKADAA